MPVIIVKLAKGRTKAQKQQFVEAVTAAAEQMLNVNRDWVNIVFDEYPRDCWATGGTLHAIKFGHGCGKDGTEK